MTAEIAVMNRQAIALAADSAITIGKERVWEYANKIFSLGPQNDIGVMIYNSGDFIGIPWDAIFKLFKKNTDVQYGKLDDAAEAFIKFISSDYIRNEQLEQISFAMIFIDIIKDLSLSIKYNNKKEMLARLNDAIAQDVGELVGVAELPNKVGKVLFKREYSSLIVELFNEKFRYQLDSRTKKALIDLCFEHVARESVSEFFTGVVFAGFGQNDMFPSIVHLVVDGKSHGFTRIWKTTGESLNKSNKSFSYIYSFAQKDVIALFMEGIASKYLMFLENTMLEVLNNKSESIIEDYIKDNDEKIVERNRQARDNDLIVSEFMKEFSKYRHGALVQPLMKAVSSLPKEEMAVIAEALVEITALRRRLDSNIQSVGGPVDVAIISKSDGFIWIKRKHYFDLEKNRDFLYRKEQELKGGSSHDD